MRINMKRLIKEEKYCKKVFEFFIKTGAIRKEQVSYKRHLDKSLSNLEFANFILEERDLIKAKLNKSFYDWCIVIYYYAVYHSALALLSRIGYKSKNHLASICAIILFYYHKNNVLEKEDINFIVDKIGIKKEDVDFLIDSKELRERASYRVDESFDLMLVKKLQEETVEFVNKVRENLENE